MDKEEIKKVNELHLKATEKAGYAFIERDNQNLTEAQRLFTEAFEFEKAAASSIPIADQNEPSRSVLFRSAASLAFNAGKNRDAEMMVLKGLLGNPPLEIENELKDFYEQINFQRHLEIKGIDLEPNEMQLSIAGPGVGYGIAKSEELINRISNIKDMTFRTIQRLNRVPYRDKGRLSSEIKDRYEPYISIPRAASFAVTIRLGKPKESKRLFTEIDPKKSIIEEIMDNIDLINNEKIDELKKKINNEPYFVNFLGLTKKLAPDGKNITTVGLSTQNKEGERSIALNRPGKKIVPATSKILDEKSVEEMSFELKGILTYADAKQKIIKLTDEKNIRWDVKVPEGLSDIVKYHWEDLVIVRGSKIGPKKIILEDIDKVD